MNPALVVTWKLNLQKSKYDPGPAPKSATRTYDGLKVTTETVNADGMRAITEHLTNWDGRHVPYYGNPRIDTVAIQQIDANTRELMFS